MPEFVYFAQKMANLKKLTVRNPALATALVIFFGS